MRSGARSGQEGGEGNWLAKDAENLDRDERPCVLQEPLEINKAPFVVGSLKRELRELWGQNEGEEAERFLLDWVQRAEASGIPVLTQFAEALRIHARGPAGLVRRRNLHWAFAGNDQ
ncbi:MAG: transposase [Planctomycetes bacterium]|nr:transposase [Planctomycetota bacterium]